MFPNARLSEQSKIVPCLTGVVPAGSTPTRVNLKNYSRVAFLILVKNGGAGVVGSAITLKQARDAAGTGEKAIPFTLAKVNLDTAASDTLSDLAVSGDTFTTDATVNKTLLYEVGARVDSLDIDNGFTFVRVGTGDATAATVTVVAVLWLPRYAGSTLPSALTN